MAPTLIQLEEEIDRELAAEDNNHNSLIIENQENHHHNVNEEDNSLDINNVINNFNETSLIQPPQIITNDLHTLHERVSQSMNVSNQCFPLTKS